MNLTGKTILITGGAGFLGRALVKKLHKDNKIIVYSRDEAKHYYLSKEFPNIECVIGDVSNEYRLEEVAGDFNVDTGIFCASLKQIESCEKNPTEAANTILYGAINSRKVAKKLNFESACFLSTDKSCEPTVYYGMLKAAAETQFVRKEKTKNKTKFSSCRYGNVVGSTGSQYPLMHQALKKDYELTLFSEEMTRFFITIDEAVDLVQVSLNHHNKVIIPKLRSYRIKDSFDLFQEKFGLKYKVGKPRANEKLHEVMIGREEVPRTLYMGGINSFKDSMEYYTISPEVQNDKINLPNNEFSSRDVCISKEELKEFLEKHNWFQ